MFKGKNKKGNVEGYLNSVDGHKEGAGDRTSISDRNSSASSGDSSTNSTEVLGFQEGPKCNENVNLSLGSDVSAENFAYATICNEVESPCIAYATICNQVELPCSENIFYAEDTCWTEPTQCEFANEITFSDILESKESCV